MENAPSPFTATDWAAWLEEAESCTRKVYKLSPERLIAEYRREREITRGYHGREILELLQNAGDAARMAGVPGKVRIVVTSHGLVIGNTGCPFDEGGVQSLQTANLSPKRQREAVVIGDKGLGFRSILNWTHSPLISSGELGLAFLPGYAEAVVRGLAAESEYLAQRVTDEREIAGDLIVPRLAFPQWVPDWENHVWPEEEGLRSIATACATLRREGFDTAVGMPFSIPQAYHEAVQQIAELKREFLLLVDSIAQLEIQIDGRQVKVWSCDRSDGRCMIREGNQEVSAWTVAAFDGELPGDLLDTEERTRSRFQLTFAVPDAGQAGPGCLFCYFPTDVQIPLPLLVHATVELDETRKHLNDTPANRHILMVMAKRIAELAEQQIDPQGADGWAGCRMVTPVGSWARELEQFGVPAILKEAGKQKKLVPVLGGGHRTALEAKSAPGDAAKWWPARLFPEMAAVEGEGQRMYAKHLGVELLPTEQLVMRLVATADLTLIERAYAIAGLLQSTPPPARDNLSALLCDETGTQLPSGVSAIFQPTGELPPLPQWATIRFLHPELRRQLSELLGSTDSRVLQQKLRPFEVMEYSLSALISPVLAEANRQVRDRPHDESAIRGEALRFLWQVHLSVGNDTAFPSDATVNLLNQEGNWTEGKLLYLGEGYGREGDVTQDLYARWAKGKLVASPTLLGLDSVEPGNIARFLLWVGVARWPRETKAHPIDQRFLEAVKDGLHFPADFGDYKVENRQSLAGAWIDGAKTVDGLAEILANAIPEAVLAWVTIDTRMASWSRPAPEHGKLKIRPYKAWYDRDFSGPLPSYTQWQIASTFWLPSTAGTKQAPRRCLIVDRQLEVLFPSPSQPTQALLERYGITDRVNEAFRLVGVMPGLAQLGRDDLYRLLLEVPELSPDGKAGLALCRWFVSNEGYVFGSAGPYQDRFLRQGKVWGSKGGVSGYYFITELRHVDQEGFPLALTAKLPIADLPKRVGAQKVKDVLGIKPLERTAFRQEMVSHRAIPEQDNRAAWFDAAKSCIKRLRQIQSKQAQAVGSFDRLSLIVCDELHIQMRYENTSYDHTAQEGEWFVIADQLYVRGDLDDSLDLLADAVGVAVASVFDMADGDAFAKILRCEPQSRGKLLKRMCGDDFNVELEAAMANPLPRYSGPIEPPTASVPNQTTGNPEEQRTEECDKNKSVSSGQEAKTPGVISITHEQQPPPARRKIIVRNVRRTTGTPNGHRNMVDGELYESLAADFEAHDTPSRYALGVGHITGWEAPGVDLVSFASEEDRTVFQNSIPRDWSKVQRFIEVKGRSSATAKIELKGNELRAAREHCARYYLYHIYEAAVGQFYVTILQSPMNADEAKETIIEVDLDRARATQRFEFIVDANDTVSVDKNPEAQPKIP